MERFKAVEKAMKTKAYSKEGLASSTKLDPAEQARAEAGDFLGNQVDELEQQIETLEAESEQIQATMKKGKSQTAKAERIAEIDRVIERHKWHQGKLELIRRSLENGGIDTDAVTDLEESIRYYVTDNTSADFIEDDTMYDDLNLDEEEGVYGVPQEDKGSSQDNASLAEETAPEPEPKPVPPPATKAKQMAAEAAATTARKTSAQVKSPLPALATLHTPPSLSNGTSSSSAMKPASIPARPAEGLKYASAAAAAAAADKIGISPLPPPPGASPVPTAISMSQSRTSATSSPAITSAQPVSVKENEFKPYAQEGLPSSARATPAPSKPEKSRPATKAPAAAVEPSSTTQGKSSSALLEVHNADQVTGSRANGARPVEVEEEAEEEEEEDSIYHLPEALQDLVEAYEITRRKPADPSSPTTQRMLQLSQTTAPDVTDMDIPQRYRPDVKVPATTDLGFPSDPLPIFDNPQLYSKIDPDTLFYVFYYRQGTPQQYLAAKALKDQSWRFHKQYQTWFQRHEEPKNITEEFEQGTYRFFDYESTW